MRGYTRGLVRYRWRRVFPAKLDYGKKALDDYGGFTYEQRLVTDDFGNRTDPRKHSPDVDYDWPLRRRP